ncbi:MAG: CBS domain-containing protein [Rhodospirillaceae bacterium]|jgi:CBS domain-containing protein|nr:CBS domain-containing protein [Rhodospirillaceae bacterium]MBT3929262.1 CBS domain-containing protein [Rhodospirillaceae bacterium]MBT4773065.1 CBS domain-containing protein [Rhodospirillaceae bacterium]MBT5358786.1 CBS domain-containing protein [Rhodospirillaceae bacterium]MBT5768511.1 CBS domain-containing protein [Rhodospirillaceae bacterium]
MNVATILRNKGNAIETARPDMSVSEACTLLTELGIGSLVVSTDGRQVEGIISERDVIRHLARVGADILDLRISEIMIRDVVTCTSEDNIAHLMETMTEHRIRHLPVVQDGTLIGLVSIGDVVKHRIRETEQEAEALKAYIATG